MQSPDNPADSSLSSSLVQDLSHHPNENQEDLFDDEYFYDEDQYESEEDEEYPTVYYQTAKKTNQKEVLKEKARQAEELKARNQTIQINKALDLQESQKMRDIIEDPQDFFRLKSQGRISRTKQERALHCLYIPERNLLMVLLEDGKTINIYSTLSSNFKLVSIKKLNLEAFSMEYMKPIKMIVFCGPSSSIVLWNVNTLEEIASTFKKWANPFTGAVYVPKAHVLAVKCSVKLCIYTLSLQLVHTFYPQGVHSFSIDLLGLSEKIILSTYITYGKKACALLNLKTKEIKKLTNFELPRLTCIEITQKTPTTILTCLAKTTENVESSEFSNGICPLAQFKVDYKAMELVLYKTSGQDFLFNELHSMRNNGCFFGTMKILGALCRNVVLRVCGEKVQILKVLVPFSLSLMRMETWALMKGGGCLIGIDNMNKLTAYKCMIKIKNDDDDGKVKKNAIGVVGK